jgi:putative ABC transport system ATP-binding protein
VHQINTSTDSTKKPALRVERLGKTVPTADGPLAILQGIDFSIAAGESVAITGPSGSGKSTLLSMLAGLDTPSEGAVYLMQKNISALDEDGRAQLRGQYVGFVFQSFQLLPHLSALENVMLPLEIQGVDLKKAKLAASACLEQVGLAGRLKHFSKTLSGGEQQRVALARAFVGKPAILFADEPTGSLDEASGAKVIDLLFELNRANGSTLVLVTHDSALASRCGRQLVLHGGRLV